MPENLRPDERFGGGGTSVPGRPDPWAPQRRELLGQEAVADAAGGPSDCWGAAPVTGILGEGPCVPRDSMMHGPGLMAETAWVGGLLNEGNGGLPELDGLPSDPMDSFRDIGPPGVAADLPRPTWDGSPCGGSGRQTIGLPMPPPPAYQTGVDTGEVGARRIAVATDSRGFEVGFSLGPGARGVVGPMWGDEPGSGSALFPSNHLLAEPPTLPRIAASAVDLGVPAGGDILFGAGGIGPPSPMGGGSLFGMEDSLGCGPSLPVRLPVPSPIGHQGLVAPPDLLVGTAAPAAPQPPASFAVDPGDG